MPGGPRFSGISGRGTPNLRTRAPRRDRGRVAPMRQAGGSITVRTRGRGLVDITDEVRSWLDGQSIVTGLLTLFCTHTSASLLIQENASPAVRSDLESFFERIAPEGANLYE